MGTNPARNDAKFTLPTFALLAAVTLAGLGTGLAWYIFVTLTNGDMSVAMAGPAGAGVVTLIAIASVLVMSPWKARAVDLWMTFWLAGTVVRLLVTPLAAFLLYSATQLPANALALAVALSYFLTVMTESALLARHVRRHC